MVCLYFRFLRVQCALQNRQTELRKFRMCVLVSIIARFAAIEAPDINNTCNKVHHQKVQTYVLSVAIVIMHD
jgi:hypothetical protein